MYSFTPSPPASAPPVASNWRSRASTTRCGTAPGGPSSRVTGGARISRPARRAARCRRRIPISSARRPSRAGRRRAGASAPGVPFRSPEGQDYFGAMCAAANFAWANRQLITHWVREAFERVFGRSERDLGMDLVYDVAHNIAKVEEYEVNGRRMPVCVHRKGATRAFPPGHPEVPARYRGIGQPVLIPGDMGRYSFVALGTDAAMRLTFGSTCHGAGRAMGRRDAVRALHGGGVAGQLRSRGIIVRAQDRSLLAEEASQAYKDVANVVDICHNAGISRRVVRTRPIGVVKG